MEAGEWTQAASSLEGARGARVLEGDGAGQSETLALGREEPKLRGTKSDPEWHPPGAGPAAVTSCWPSSETDVTWS